MTAFRGSDGKVLWNTNVTTLVLLSGLEAPCLGHMTAFRGSDGKVLWNTSVTAEVFLFECDGIDINKDGMKDCVGAGRMGTMVAFNPKNGKYQSNSLGPTEVRGFLFDLLIVGGQRINQIHYHKLGFFYLTFLVGGSQYQSNSFLKLGFLVGGSQVSTATLIPFCQLWTSIGLFVSEHTLISWILTSVDFPFLNRSCFLD
jgi:hypothetical protein